MLYSFIIVELWYFFHLEICMDSNFGTYYGIELISPEESSEGWKQNYLFALFFTSFYSSVFDLLDGWFIRKLYFCIPVFIIFSLIYLIGGLSETYLFVHWYFSFVIETYQFVHWFLLFCDRIYISIHWFLLFWYINISFCSLVLTLLLYEPICLFTDFYSYVKETYLFDHWLSFFFVRNLSVFP